jgi:Sec-independent protein secretion pathway component TatC
MYLLGIPLLLIPFALYNIIAFITPGLTWQQDIADLHMVSGQAWAFTPGDILIAFSILILFAEFMKATRMSNRTIIDHMLSTLLFIVMIIEFLLVKQAATGTFFLLLVISFVDVVGGFTITIRTAQRDITVDRVAGA